MFFVVLFFTGFPSGATDDDDEWEDGHSAGGPTISETLARGDQQVPPDENPVTSDENGDNGSAGWVWPDTPFGGQE